MKSLIELTSAKNPKQFIDAAIPLLPSSNISNKQEFVDAVFECFDAMLPSSIIAAKDYGVRLFYMLRGSKKPVTKLLSSFSVVCPHSMTVEKCVSTYNMLFSDLLMATSEATLNSRLMIHWNGVPTAKFDPRPSVQAFLTLKDRRMNLPKLDSYRERDFVKKFFI